MMKTRLLAFYFCLIFSTAALAQLSPPGMGTTGTAFWSAIGVRQQLDEKNSSVTYAGLGRISGTAGDVPFNMPSIAVLNQEFYHKLSPKWQYSAAVSYRRQHEYDEGFEEEVSAAINQEFRVYGRLQYAVKFGSAKWAATFRQEVRKFYTDGFAEVPDGLQLRSRLKVQLVVPLDADGEHSLMGSAESLFAIVKDRHTGWGDMDYKESRFCLYYSLSPKSLPFAFDIGYMNDLVGYGSHKVDADYLAMDIMINDPF